MFSDIYGAVRAVTVDGGGCIGIHGATLQGKIGPVEPAALCSAVT